MTVLGPGEEDRRNGAWIPQSWPFPLGRVPEPRMVPLGEAPPMPCAWCGIPCRWQPGTRPWVDDAGYTTCPARVRLLGLLRGQHEPVKTETGGWREAAVYGLLFAVIVAVIVLGMMTASVGP